MSNDAPQVPSPVPAIYTRLDRRQRLAPAARLLALAIALGCLAVLIVAAWLTPSPSGIGTHTQLGLSPCAWPATSGLPCPTCGMTTSFAYFVRGRLLASLHAQPMGTLLAALAAMTVWAGLYIAATARPVHRLLRLLPARWAIALLAAAAIAAWGWKMLAAR